MNNKNIAKYKSSLFMMCIAAVISVTAVFSAYLLWKAGFFLPKWIRWDEKSITDISGEYNSVLENKVATVKYKSDEIWRSPSNIRVQDMLVYDIDNDGDDELILLVWRIGIYGDAKPFWVTEAESGNDTWSQHLFLYEFNEDKVNAKWMSSYLGPDVFDIVKDEGDTKNRIQFIERNGGISVWGWNSWGFTKVDED